MYASLRKINMKFERASIPSVLLLRHKNSSIVYDKCYLDRDNTVSYESNDIIYGGEISSRLYHNKKYDWEEIEKMSDILQESNAQIRENCSNQVNIELSRIRQKRKFIEALSKIIANYERELEIYYMGDFYLDRLTKIQYASSISSYLRSVIKYIDFEDKSDEEINHLLLPIFSKRAGINLSEYLEKKRIEIRYPNGTLNKKTIQNNINFSIKLIDALADDKFDLEKVTAEISNSFEHNGYYELINEQCHLERFRELVNIVAINSEDENDFMCQYEKVKSTKPGTR